ncbi:TetR-like C-terminal domain-containing protein [Clostridium sp. AWRP]|uniref:TetR-like C-terminal domain-containing protein n=1 Tax=Clostridium sp. AWRP TaxID=2212991 RepID=UPI000FDBC3AC|nr:TetR-like C-terminal domain-containing protein [Clostridium sp. AWRP]AZV55645.1 WHG domain-containing protein [Clostridium sp. AWRP]
MAPKTKISKADIITASLAIVRESGVEALNARSVAQKLNCSTQPIFSNYSTMEDLKTDVMQSAKQIYQQFIERGMEGSAYPPYKASGIYYIKFAREEKELFKLLFMRDRSQEEIKEEREDISKLLHLISANTGMSLDDAFMFHIEMWTYAHGIATMIATSYLDWQWDMISMMLTDAYEGMRERYKNKEGK